MFDDFLKYTFRDYSQYLAFFNLNDNIVCSVNRNYIGEMIAIN